MFYSAPGLEDTFMLAVSFEKGVSLLGGGVSRDLSYLTSLADKRVSKWIESINLMMDINDPFIQLLLLRSCLGVSKLNYLLRTTPPNLIGPSICKMETFLKDVLWSITTNKRPGFTEFQFQLATLPINESGLGIYNPADICQFAFIASFSQTKKLQDQILDLTENSAIDDMPSMEFQTLKETFLTTYNNKVNIEMPAITQASLASIFYKVKRNMVINDPYITLQPNVDLRVKFLAILESYKIPHTSAYLFALPNFGLNQVMSAAEFRADMALRLLIPKFSGVKICSAPKCCSPMDSFGYHAINCRGSLFERHEEVLRALLFLTFDAQLNPRKNAPVKCLGPSWRKPKNVVSDSTLTWFRPADLLIDHDGLRRKCVDVTVVSPIKANMPVTFIAGKDALRAQQDKISKHADACFNGGFYFAAFAVDVFGVLAPGALSLLKHVASLLEGTQQYSKPLALAVVFRRISFAIHKGVAKQLVDRMESGMVF
jgi:hypothetical protein